MEHPFAQFKFCPKCGSENFIINNEKSKKCTNCNFSYYFNPSAAAVAIIMNSNRQILVCRRANDPKKGSLDFPGGFVDMNESGEEAVAREVFEETNLTVSSVKYLFSLPNEYLYSKFLVHTLDLFYLCQVKDFDHIMVQDDISEAYFANIDDLVMEDFGLQSIKKGLSILKSRNIL